MKTQIVETVTAGDMASLRRDRDAVVDADLVELRLDYVRDLDVAGALRDRTRPVVVTCRPTWEGGQFDGAEECAAGFLPRRSPWAPSSSMWSAALNGARTCLAHDRVGAVRSRFHRHSRRRGRQAGRDAARAPANREDCR